MRSKKNKNEFSAFTSGENSLKKLHKKKELGRCKLCGRPLTDPISALRGCGPECYRKIQGEENEWNISN